MRALLSIGLFIGSVSTLTCSSQYTPMEGMCIRRLNQSISDTITHLLPVSRNECGRDGAYLPIIKNDKENDAFNRIALSFADTEEHDTFTVLDLDCNKNTHRLEWIDGTPVNYSPGSTINYDFDCVSTGNTVISQPEYSDWQTVYNDNNMVYSTFCVIDETDKTTVKTTMQATTLTPTASTVKVSQKPTEMPENEQCGDYTLMTNPSDDKKPCLKVFSDPLSWVLAQEKCAADFASLITINTADENKYFWRTAISNNILEGMHIGAHQSNEDKSVWTWVDGEVPFNGETYDNFIASFPIPGAGECSAMLTETTAALWTNEDCNENEQPFICRRDDFSTLPKDCPAVAPKAGEDILPPGFPTSNIPCEYMLFVSPGKLVELEVMTLVAENNKDYLEILEGSSGPHPLANLTGTILTSTKFTTVKSNVLRVNWKPNGVGDGRGFRIRYNEIDP